jgi:hypothetical protein
MPLVKLVQHDNAIANAGYFDACTLAALYWMASFYTDIKFTTKEWAH